MHNTSASKQQKIWHTVLQIPAGKIASYGQIADLAGLPGRARLVGKTLGQAPSELQLPWYRVMRSGGQIAFAAGTVQALAQQQLLLTEGVQVRNGRVAKEFWWQPDLAELLFRLQY